MKWIRWQGLFAFLVLVVVLAAIWFWLVDTWVKHAIEQAGTAAVGAKVELDAADLRLSPLGLSLTRLQVTDPEKPMTNAVEIATLTATLDPLQLFRRKVIIEDMTVEGLRFGTARSTSGAIVHHASHAKETTDKADGFHLPALEFNDPKQILAKELDQLQSLALAESLRAEAESEKARWQQRIADLPDKAKFTEYKGRIQQLKSSGKGGLSGILGGVEDLVRLQDEVKQDLAKIASVKQNLEQSVSSLKKRSRDLVDAPRADLRRLMQKYSISGQGLTNLTRLLVRGPLADYMQTAMHWHQRLEPYLSRNTTAPGDPTHQVDVVTPLRAKGQDVHFPEHAPLPEWLVRTARVSIMLPAGTLGGEVKNLTAEQPILGTPLTFAFSGTQLKGVESIKLQGSVNRVNPTAPKDQATLAVSASRLDQLKLGGDNMPITLAEGLADLTVRADLTGGQMETFIASDVRNVQIHAPSNLAPGPVGEALAGALADVKGFHVDATLKGTPEQYDMTVHSNLDDILQSAVGKQAAAQMAKLEGQLRTAIDEKVSGTIGQVRSQLADFDGLLQELTARLNLGEDVLKSAASGALGGKSPRFKLPF